MTSYDPELGLLVPPIRRAGGVLGGCTALATLPEHGAGPPPAAPAEGGAACRGPSGVHSLCQAAFP